jgi:peptidoglycan/LPS O-acetylase OafA/YrhL
MILVWSLNQPEACFRYLSPLAWIGRYSYSIYLWHVIVFVLMERYLPLSGWLVTYLVASIVLGVILAKVIEIPFLRLRDKLVLRMQWSVACSEPVKGAYEPA